jgi:hypothetical protein
MPCAEFLVVPLTYAVCLTSLYLQAYVQDSSARVRVNFTQAWCNSSHENHTGHCIDAYIFKCALRQPPQLTLAQQVAVGVAVSFCIVLLAVMANTCMAHASKVRRYYIRAKTRLQGAPKHGRMSLVVTDIEGYSGGHVAVWCSQMNAVYSSQSIVTPCFHWTHVR